MVPRWRRGDWPSWAIWLASTGVMALGRLHRGFAIPDLLGVGKVLDTFVTIVITATASMLGLTVAVVILAVDVRRQMYGSHRLERAFDNPDLRTLLNLYIFTMLSGLSTLIAPVNAIIPAYLALILFTLTIIMTIGLVRRAVTRGASDHGVASLARSISAPMVEVYADSLAGLGADPAILFATFMPLGDDELSELMQIYSKALDQADDALALDVVQGLKPFCLSRIAGVLSVLRGMCLQAMSAGRELVVRHIWSAMYDSQITISAPESGADRAKPDDSGDRHRNAVASAICTSVMDIARLGASRYTLATGVAMVQELYRSVFGTEMTDLQVNAYYERFSDLIRSGVLSANIDLLSVCVDGMESGTMAIIAHDPMKYEAKWMPKHIDLLVDSIAAGVSFDYTYWSPIDDTKDDSVERVQLVELGRVVLGLLERGIVSSGCLEAWAKLCEWTFSDARDSFHVAGCFFSIGVLQRVIEHADKLSPRDSAVMTAWLRQCIGRLRSCLPNPIDLARIQGDLDTLSTRLGPPPELPSWPVEG